MLLKRKGSPLPLVLVPVITGPLLLPGQYCLGARAGKKGEKKPWDFSHPPWLLGDPFLLLRPEEAFLGVLSIPTWSVFLGISGDYKSRLDDTREGKNGIPIITNLVDLQILVFFPICLLPFTFMNPRTAAPHILSRIYTCIKDRVCLLCLFQN